MVRPRVLVRPGSWQDLRAKHDAATPVMAKSPPPRHVASAESRSAGEARERRRQRRCDWEGTVAGGRLQWEGTRSFEDEQQVTFTAWLRGTFPTMLAGGETG